MPTMQDIIRRITVQASQTGATETAAALRNVATEAGNVAVAVERTGAATLSVASKLNTLQKSLDATYLAEQKMAAIEKTLTAARNEGLISAQRENELLSLASAKYREVGAAAEFMAQGLDIAKEVTKGLVATLGPLLAITALAELPSKLIETVHEVAGLNHAAETIGTTTKALQELQYTGSQFHVSAETMDSALEKFSKNLGIAATGTGALNKILKENHVAITGDFTKDFENYANLIEHSTSAEQRNLLTTTAFGKGAAELGLMFDHGAEGIRKFNDEADQVGAVLDDGALKSAQDLDAEFIKMQAQLDVTFKNFAVTIAPLIEGALTDIIKLVREANSVINAGKDLASIVSNAGKPLAEQSDEYLKSDIATLQKLIAEHRDFIATVDSQGNVMSVQAKLSAETEELTRRASTPSSLHDGDTSRPGTSTITRDTSGDAAAAKQASEIKKVTDALNLQIAALTETNRQKEIDTELSKAHVAASSKEGQAIEALAGKYYDEKKAIDDANQAANFLAQTTESAFAGILDGSTSVTDAIGNIAKALASAVLQAELLGSGPLAGILGTSPTTSGGAGGILGSLFSALIPHALGGVHTSPSLSAYSGQIVSSPTMFKFASGMGLMGEAGPEAILPLKRGPNGSLGVAANSNGGGASVTNIYHIDAQGAEIGVEQKIVNALKQYDQQQPARVLKIVGDKRSR